jgi:hypothetical protein
MKMPRQDDSCNKATTKTIPKQLIVVCLISMLYPKRVSCINAFGRTETHPGIGQNPNTFECVQTLLLIGQSPNAFECHHHEPRKISIGGV